MDIDKAIGLLDKFQALAASLAFISVLLSVVMTQVVKSTVKVYWPTLPPATVWGFCAILTYALFWTICRRAGQDVHSLATIGLGLTASVSGPFVIHLLRIKFGIDIDAIIEDKHDDGPPLVPPAATSG